MNRFTIFVMRAILAVAFAVFLTRFFYPKADIVHAAGLGIFLIGMAYFLEYLRNRKSKY